MGFNNPSVPWSDLERTLSGRRSAVPTGANGGDSPAWSSHRPAYEPPERLERPRGAVPYAELHCHSNFSFLDGASHPEELVEEAARLGLEALALTDHDGFYGVVRFAEAAPALGLPTVFGAELTLQDRNWRAAGSIRPSSAPISRREGADPEPDPPGTHLLVLARDPVGYARLARAISRSQMAGEKGAPRLTLDELAEHAGHASGRGSHWAVLTGCRKGAVPAALEADGPAAAARRLAELVERFGRDKVAVELWDHGDPLDSARNDALADLAIRAGVDLVATNNVHYATRPAGRWPPRSPRCGPAAASTRSRAGSRPGPAPTCARGPSRPAASPATPGVVQRAAELGLECAFDLQLVAPNLPPFPCPDGLDEMGYLRRLVAEKAARPQRYGPPDRERVPGAYAQIDHELDLIEQLGFPGYFLIVWDIVRFCQEQRHLLPGPRLGRQLGGLLRPRHHQRRRRAASACCSSGSSPPSATARPTSTSTSRATGARRSSSTSTTRHGRDYAAQVANVITYRAKSAVRDMAKALGSAPGQQDAWSKQVDRWGPVAATAGQADITHPGRRCSSWPRRSSTSPATSASTRAAW